MFPEIFLVPIILQNGIFSFFGLNCSDALFCSEISSRGTKKKTLLSALRSTKWRHVSSFCTTERDAHFNENQEFAPR